jgi:hypothetical protein
MWMNDSDFGWKWIPEEILAEMIADGVTIPDPDPLDDDPRAERDDEDE